jgi:WD40 repeat protein
MAATLAKRPEDRPATPGELAARLAPFCVGQPSVPPTVQPQPGDELVPTRVEGLPPPLTLPEGPGRPFPWAWVAGLVGVALVVALAFWALRPPASRQEEDDPEKEKPAFEIARLPEGNRRPWHPPELVAVLGDDRWRHWGSVAAISVGAAGKRVATRGGDGMVRIWETATGRPLAMLPTWHTSGRNVAIDSTGEVVAAGADTGTVWLWRAPEWQRQQLKRHKHDVTAVAFVPGTRVLVSAAGPVVRWGDVEAEGGLSEFVCPGAKGVRSLACREDGTILVGDDTGTIHWASPSVPARKIRSKHDEVQSIAFAPGGRLLTAHKDGHVCLWDEKSGEHFADLTTHKGVAAAVAVSPDGKWLGSAGWDNMVYLYGPDGRKPPRKILGAQRLNSLAFLPGPESTLLVGGDEGRVVAWSPSTSKEPQPSTSHSGPVRSMMWLPGGELATAGEDGIVRFWSLATGRCRAYATDFRCDIMSLALVDGMLAVAGKHESVLLLDPATGKKRGEIQNGRWAYTICPLPGGRLLVGGEPSQAEVWDVARRTKETLPPHREQCFSSAADGERFAIGDGSWEGEGTAHLFRLDCQPAGTYGKHHGSVTALAFHKGRLASGDYCGVVRIDNKAVGEKHPGRVNAIRWSADGHLATACAEGVVMWRDAEGNRVTGWKFPGGVCSLALTPDGRHLLTGNADGTVFVLRLP